MAHELAVVPVLPYKNGVALVGPEVETLERTSPLPRPLQEETIQSQRSEQLDRASRLSLILRKLRSHLRAFTICSIFASVSSFCFGFDTGSIGPIISMYQFSDAFDIGSPTTQGLIVSSILITASLSSAIAGPLSDRISRTHTFALGGAVFCIGSVLSAAANGLPMLFTGRLIAGTGEGLFMSTVTVYVLEIAPTNIRGRLSCTAQLFVTLGLASGYFVAYATVQLPSSLSWRLLFVLQSIVSGLFAAGALFLPHSPRWLAHVGRTADARRAWERLGYTAAEVEKELEVQQREEREEAAAVVGRRNERSTLRMLFSKDVRRRTFLGVFLMAMQQACGIDGVLYYAPVLFKQAGLSSTTAAFLASGVSGLLNVACTIVTQIFTDKWGRRPSMIRGGSVISFCMLAIGILYASGAADHAAGRWAVVALIYAFIVAFSMSWAVVNRIYCSEIQPMHTRAAATSLGQCANWIVNWVIAFSTPLFLARSSFGPYFLFGACSLLTVVVCTLFQPESRGVSLEALEGIFEVSPWRQMVSGARKMLARMGRHATDVPIALHPLGTNTNS